MPAGVHPFRVAVWSGSARKLGAAPTVGAVSMAGRMHKRRGKGPVYLSRTQHTCLNAPQQAALTYYRASTVYRVSALRL